MPAVQTADALTAEIPACVWILRFDQRGHASPGDSRDLAALGGGTAGFVWLHLDRADARLQDLLQTLPCLTPEARAALGGAVDHQFVEHVDGLVSGAIVDHQHGFEGTRTDTDFLRFAIGADYLVTSRRSPLHATQSVRRALDGGRTAPSAIALFEMIVVDLCECSGGMMREISSVLDIVEDNVVIEGRGRDQRGKLGSARRKAVRLSRQVNGLQSTLKRLEEAAAAPEHEEIADVASALGQRADSLCRDALNLQDRARMLQDEINAILTLETNDRLYMLTIVTATLLPATLVTGYFGMNTKQLLFSESDNGTIYATLICVFASVAALLFMRRMGLTEAKPSASLKDPSSSPGGAP